jgi:hypothetical protein
MPGCAGRGLAMPAETGGESSFRESSARGDEQGSSGGRPPARGGEDGDCVVVLSKAELRSLEAYILGEREHPVVALTPSLMMPEPAFAPGAIREIVGPGARIYFIPGTFMLHRLQDALGRRLAPAAGTARIWWPGFNLGSDPREHPLVQRLEGESDESAVEEFARCFDLSRPRVRREIELIEDARALAERERDQAVERARELEQLLRDAQIACRDAVERAERAEARVDPAG